MINNIILLLLAELAVVASQYPFPYPHTRYTEWDELEPDEQYIARSLGYARSSWNSVSQTLSIEKSAFSVLSAEQQQNIMALDMDEEMWDCFVNHYDDYWWSELELEGIAEDFEALGWTQQMWNQGGVADTDDLFWRELTVEEQEAAKNVCYKPLTWNLVPLDQWCSSGVVETPRWCFN